MDDYSVEFGNDPTASSDTSGSSDTEVEEAFIQVNLGTRAL